MINFIIGFICGSITTIGVWFFITLKAIFNAEADEEDNYIY